VPQREKERVSVGTVGEQGNKGGAVQGLRSPRISPRDYGEPDAYKALHLQRLS
jgi:hypothetical protein